MNEPRYGQKSAPDTSSGATTPTADGQAPAVGQAGGGQAAGQGVGHGTSPGASQTSGKGVGEAVIGAFTIRDLSVFAATLILFVASLLPLFGASYNLWNINNLFFLALGILLPLAVSGLLVARRLAPKTKLRVGSLSVDQFASVVASFALAFFFLAVTGFFSVSLLVGLIGSLVFVAATVFGRFLPYLSADFANRAEVPAHVVARDAVAPTPKPRAPKEPKAPKPAKPSAAGATSADQVSSHADIPTAAVAPSAAAASTPAGRTSGAAAPQTQGGAVVPSATAAAAVTPAAATPAAGATQSATSQPTAPDAGAASAGSNQSATPATAAHPVASQQGAPTPAVSDRTAAHQTVGTPAATTAPATAVHQQVRAEEPIGATVDPASRPEEHDDQPAYEAFWFAVAQHRTTVDPQTGQQSFGIEPGGWVLALEDRGHEFLVQHTDGRLGLLRDLSNIERG